MKTVDPTFAIEWPSMPFGRLPTKFVHSFIGSNTQTEEVVSRSSQPPMIMILSSSMQQAPFFIGP